MAARKGGAGKTVVTVLLARELARQGARVLVVDLDPQRVGASIRLGADVSSPLLYTALDLVKGVTGGGRPFQAQAIIPERIDVVAANQADLAAFEKRLSVMYEELKLMSLRPRRAVLDVRLREVASGYDYVLIDTPTGFGEITSNALEAADLVLSPIDMQSSDNVESVLDLLAHVAEIQRGPSVRFIANKVKRGDRELSVSLARARLLCGDRFLADILLPASTAVPQAMSEKRDLKIVGSETAILFSQRMWELAQFVMSQAQGMPLGTVGGAR
jgi:cellulose biosynthesis protein BcsQ